MHVLPQFSDTFRKLWAISWPMILAAMSSYFMTLVDRIILSNYSTDAFVAAASAHPYYWAFTRAMMALIAMSNVFVAQCYGAHNYKKIGKIAWQTLFIAFSYYILIVPFALHAKSFLASTTADLGAPYLSIILLFLPFHLAGFGAISAFFLGIGRTRIVPVVILISNIINIVLDFGLIFGRFGLPELGIRGAAYATGISQLIAFLIFLYEFLKKTYRDYYQTHVPKFSLALMKQLLPLGVPNAVNSILNSGGFAIVNQIIAAVCVPEDLLAFTIANSIYLFFWFFTDGLGKGICTVCSQYIGNGKMHYIKEAVQAVIICIAAFAAVTAIFMIIFPQTTLRLFYNGEVTNEFFHHFRGVLFWTWIALVIDALRWMTQNILISAGDVKFTMTSNVSCFWLAAFTPIYIFVYKLHWCGASFCWQCFILDSASRIISNSVRFHSKTWRRKARLASRSSRAL